MNKKSYLIALLGWWLSPLVAFGLSFLVASDFALLTGWLIGSAVYSSIAGWLEYRSSLTVEEA